MVMDMLLKKAVLIIHGFAGGTYDEEELANYLELNRGFDVFQFTLPGHEKNLSKVERQEWINASEEQIEWLIRNGYNKIYLIGHSMGGVIATYLASKYKEVKKLILAAPAYHYLKVIKDDLNVSKSLKVAPQIIKDYGSDEVIARMLKFNVSVIKEFMDLVKDYYDYPKYITCKVLILQGKEDRLVPVSSSQYVYDTVKSKRKEIVYLDGITHDIFRNEKQNEIFKLVEKFLKK
ncbi:MAG: alpha/beta fold hydrolase [Firmicutes bacterium]|nr:alpha/beta fold hydrolase [Bacillota bacterium]